MDDSIKIHRPCPSIFHSTLWVQNLCNLHSDGSTPLWDETSAEHMGKQYVSMLIHCLLLNPLSCQSLYSQWKIWIFLTIDILTVRRVGTFVTKTSAQCLSVRFNSMYWMIQMYRLHFKMCLLDLSCNCSQRVNYFVGCINVKIWAPDREIHHILLLSVCSQTVSLQGPFTLNPCGNTVPKLCIVQHTLLPIRNYVMSW